MSNQDLKEECSCECGTAKFTIQGEALVRIICHCTICQEFNDAAYSDVTIFVSKDVHLQNQETVSFKKYKSPPAVQRGTCITCHKPAIEFLDLPAFPSFTIIPSQNIPKSQRLPDPSVHIFYHRRIADVQDHLPKYSGFIKSQLGMGILIMKGMYRRFKHLKKS